MLCFLPLTPCQLKGTCLVSQFWCHIHGRQPEVSWDVINGQWLHQQFSFQIKNGSQKWTFTFLISNKNGHHSPSITTRLTSGWRPCWQIRRLLKLSIANFPLSLDSCHGEPANTSLWYCSIRDQVSTTTYTMEWTIITARVQNIMCMTCTRQDPNKWGVLEVIRKKLIHNLPVCILSWSLKWLRCLNALPQ